MNDARIRELERNQTGTARKVLDCFKAPEDEFTQREVLSALADRGIRAEPHIVMGCLRSMSEQRLLAEVATGVFKRVAWPKPASVVPVAPAAPEAVPAAEQKAALSKDSVALLGTLAGRLRQLAAELEDVALLFEEERSAESAEMSKLRKLQDALRSLAS